MTLIATQPIGEAELRERLVGIRFPVRTTLIEPYEAWLGHDAMRVPAAEPGELDPLWILVVALRGMGVSITELIELAGSTPEDGVLFGDVGFEQIVPLRQSVEYTVRGGIDDVSRRQGKRAGIFDVVTVTLEVVEPQGAVAGLVSSSFIFPRGSA